MKLIDTDVLLAQMKECYEKRAEESNMTGDRAVCVTWHDAVILIKDAPIVDAVPVIRCKDCKHYTWHTMANCYYCAITGVVLKEDDFCSYGKREE